MNFVINLATVLFALHLQNCITQYSGFPYMKENLISSDGYPLEVHHVTTEDGYVIELHRIPHGRNESLFRSKNGYSKRKKVVFLAHCLFGSSTSYLVLGPTNGLAYMIANAGYDVWLINVRGSSFSRRHVNISSNSDEFWKFSWHEHGMYDLAPSIDYVLKLTGESQLDYVGYSMGATMFMVLMSEKPEYNAKIRSMVALAPAIFLSRSNAQLLALTPTTPIFAKVFANLQRLNFPPQELQLNKVFGEFCDLRNIILFGKLCNELMLHINGNLNNIDRRMMPFFFKSLPDQTSVRTVIHFAQLRNSGKFEKYNFGIKMNRKNYGSSVPPVYDLSKVTAPVNIIHGDQDGWNGIGDVEKLMSQLPNVVSNRIVRTYRHFDFIWAKNAPSLVYDVVLKILKNSDNPQCC